MFYYKIISIAAIVSDSNAEYRRIANIITERSAYAFSRISPLDTNTNVTTLFSTTRAVRVHTAAVQAIESLEFEQLTSTRVSHVFHIVHPDALVSENQEVIDTINEIGSFTFTRSQPLPDEATVTVPHNTSIAVIRRAHIRRGPGHESRPPKNGDQRVTPSGNIEIFDTSSGTWLLNSQATAPQLLCTLHTEDVPKPEKPSVKWSTVRTKTVNFTEDYLVTQIRVRYAMFNRPLNGLSNIVVDSFIPRLLVASKLNTYRAIEIANFPSTAVTISPWFANMFGLKLMPLDDMCLFLGYNQKQIKELFLKVKTHDWSISFIGYGGTNVNTLHWLTKMAEMTNVVNTFKYVEVWENDKTDISNLLRFPKDPSTSIIKKGYRAVEDNKLALLSGELDRLSRLKPEMFSKFYDPNTSYYHAQSFVNLTSIVEPLTEDEVHEEEHGNYVHLIQVLDGNGNRTYDLSHNSRKHVFYGAPGISTRVELSKVGHFISATHGSNDCSLHLNPTQDTDLQVESYGMIQLGGFFMNQLRMAIGLLETLGDPNFDPTVQDQPLMEFEFTGKPVKACSRTYNFQMNFDGNMLNEAAAANI